MTIGKLPIGVLSAGGTNLDTRADISRIDYRNLCD